jgi:hypothetical protein
MGFNSKAKEGPRTGKSIFRLPWSKSKGEKNPQVQNYPELKAPARKSTATGSSSRPVHIPTTPNKRKNSREPSDKISEANIKSPKSRSNTIPHVKETTSSSQEPSISVDAKFGAGKAPDIKVQEAVNKLNNSVIRLYKTSALIKGDLKPEEWSNKPVLEHLGVRTLDESIELVATVTQQLIADINQAKMDRKSQKGLMVSTERFLKTTCFVISPALKNFLKVVVQGSAVISSIFYG